MGLENTRLKMELNRLKIILQGAGIDATKGLLYRTTPQDKETPVKKSILGTEVFTNLTFQSGSYLPLDGGLPISYAGLTIDSVLMVVSQTKNIITTQIQGKSGTFKEYVSENDFQIEVSGLLTNKDNTYPEFTVETLMTLFSVPDSLQVTSEFLNHFGVISPTGLSGIDEVVITDYNFPQQEGFRNQQLFNCKMISDTPIELII